MGDLSFTNAHLIGLFVYMLASGAYFAYFPRCIAILAARWFKERSRWLFLACSFIFLCMTANLIVEIYTGYKAFSIHSEESFADPHKEFAKISSPECIAKGVITIVLAMFSDIIIVYRTFILWNFNIWTAIVPVGLLLSSWAMGIWNIWEEAHTGVQNSGTIHEGLVVHTGYFFILTFCLNILCCGLICWSIWKRSLRTPLLAQGSSSTARIMYIIIESAAMYCAALFALIVTDYVQSNAYYIFLDLLPPVNAIVFTLLTTRSLTQKSECTTSAIASAPLRFGGESHQTDSRVNCAPIQFEVGVNLERVLYVDNKQHVEGKKHVKSPAV